MTVLFWYAKKLKNGDQRNQSRLVRQDWTNAAWIGDKLDNESLIMVII